jgi:hypothetical protein
MKTKFTIILILLTASNNNAHKSPTPDECSDTASLTTMAKSGQYAAASSSQQESYRQLFPDIAQAVQASLSGDQSTPVALADYGAADCLATRYLLEYITDNDPNIKIDVVINDQDSNDWDFCAQNLSPLGKLKELSIVKDTLRNRQHHVELYSNPGSFTTQLLPNASIDITTSGTAFHWLSPSNLPRPGTFRFTSPNAVDRALVAAWREHSANDWRLICQSRHAELKPGGYFFAIVPCMTVHGRETYDVLMNTVFDPILDDWVEQGLLPEKERKNIFAPVHARTVAELKAGMDEYFDIVKMDEVIMANPYLEGISLDKEHDREMFAKRYIESIFAWANTLLLNAFGGDEELVAKFKSKLIEGVVARAEEFDNDYVFATIVAVKK